MRNLINIKLFSAVLVLILTSVSISYAKVDETTKRKVVDSLAKKLKTDLADQNLSLRIKELDEYETQQEQVKIYGEALLVPAKDKVSKEVYFDAVINEKTDEVTLINYTLAEDTSEANDYLTDVVIKKLRKDYKTDDVILTVSNVEKIQTSGEKYKGIGEVMIDGLMLKEINFEIELEKENVKYKTRDM